MITQHLGEVFELFGVGQLAEEEEVSGFLKTEAFLADEPVHQIFYGYTAVKQFARALHTVAVRVRFVGVYLAYLRKPCDDARAVYIAQTALYVILLIKRRVDRAACRAYLAHLAHPGRVMCHCLFELFHDRTPLSVLFPRPRRGGPKKVWDVRVPSRMSSRHFPRNFL